MDLLLTHGYFLYEDPKELQIMKPYAPLGILYLTSHLRARHFEVEVFDSTFSSREELTRVLETEKPAVLGIYANLMTRGSVLQILKTAKQAGWNSHSEADSSRWSANILTKNLSWEFALNTSAMKMLTTRARRPV